MLRVYLDQAKWIDLAKCRAGHPGGEKFTDLLTIATAAVERNEVSFVLSCAHYYETQKRRSGKSRENLGATMAELSRFHTIAPVHKIVPAEIRQHLCNTPVESQINIFGVGFKHAFGTDFDPVSSMEISTDLLPPQQYSQIRSLIRESAERFILAAPDKSPEAARNILQVASAISSSAESFAASQATLSKTIMDQNLRARIRDVSVMSEIADILDPLITESDRCGVSMDDLLSDKESIRSLLRGLPSRWVMSELRRVRLRNPQQPWVGNDLNDLLALSIAVPYCDVVVTERQWARHINQLGLARQFDTTVFHDLTLLSGLLVDASRTGH